MRRFAGTQRIALALLHNEWRAARATLLGGIPFAGVFVAACDLVFTKDDPSFLAYTAMPAITALIVAAIAADLCSRDVDARCGAGPSMLPISSAVVFVVRIVFLAIAALVIAAGVLALSRAWLGCMRADAPMVDVWTAPRCFPLPWSAIVPAVACVVLASACAMRGLAALVVGLASFAAVAVFARGLPSALDRMFGMRIDDHGWMRIDVTATIVLLVCAALVHARGVHRVASVGRRIAWAGLALGVFLVPAGVVAGAKTYARLNVDPGDARTFEVRALAPDERQIAVVATGSSLLHAKTWLVDLSDGSVVELPGFAARVHTGVDWLDDRRVQLPFRRLSYAGSRFEARMGTFDRATGELLDETDFDERKITVHGFTLGNRDGKGVWSGFGREARSGRITFGDRSGVCAIRLDDTRREVFDLTRSSSPIAVIDGTAKDHVWLLPRNERLILKNDQETRIVSAQDGRDVFVLPKTDGRTLFTTYDGSSARYVWNIERGDDSTRATYSLLDLESGAVHSVGSALDTGTALYQTRVLDDGSLISVTSAGLLRRRALDGTETLLPLRLK